MVKITIDLPQTFIDFWTFWAKRHNKTMTEEIAYQVRENAFSMLDALQGDAVASLFNLEKEYAKWRADP